MGNSSSTGAGLMRRQVFDDEVLGHDDITVSRSRKMVSKYLKRIGQQANLNLSLDAYGYCYIPFKKFLIIIGVPDDNNGLLHFQTMVFDLDSSRGVTKIHKRVAAANLTAVSLGKHGSYLHMEGDEISLSLAKRIKGLTYREMMDSLEDFMQTAVKTNANLEAIC